MHDNTQLTNVLTRNIMQLNTIYSINCSQVTTMKLEIYINSVILGFQPFVIISAVNLRCSVHRESIKNDSNILACCMVFSLSHRAARRGPANTRRRRFGVNYTPEKRERGKKPPLNNKTKRIIKYTHWSLFLCETRGILFVHFTQAAF